MPISFTAVRRFDPSSGDSWTKYIAWSGLTHLKEVISLDGILSSTIVQELIDEDWKYNVHEDNKTHLFHDLDYLLSRVARQERINVLAITENPTAADLQQFDDPRFEFCGFDLLEVLGNISALVNCGGFDKAFQPSDLSECGLVMDYSKATEIQRLLRDEYPDEHHAECDVWAIWLMRGQ